MEALASVGIKKVVVREGNAMNGIIKGDGNGGGNKNKCREGNNRMTKELSKLDSSVNYGGKRAFLEVGFVRSKC